MPTRISLLHMLVIENKTQIFVHQWVKVYICHLYRGDKTQENWSIFLSQSSTNLSVVLN